MLIRFLLLMVLFGPGVASAANLFTPVEADRSMYVLDTMFGKLGIFGGGLSDGFASSVAVFNGAALIIGGVLVVYSLIIGTIGTAHDGEMMGKKYSSVWIPLRTVLATALILPVIGGSSYCLMQLIVGWLIVQGIGLADQIWKAYMDRPSVIQTITVGLKVQNSNKVAWDIFNSAYCTEALNLIIKDSVDDTKTGVSSSYLKYGPNEASVPKFGSTLKVGSNVSNGTIWDFGLLPNPNFQSVKFTKDMCGTVEYIFQNGGEAELAENVENATSGLSGNNSIVNQKELAATVRKAREKGLEATKTLISEMQSIAKEYAQSVHANENIQEGALSAQVKTLIADYHQAFAGQIGELLAQNAGLEKIQELSSRDGWVMAGAWFMKMAAMQDAAGQISDIRPTANYKDPSLINSEVGNAYLIKFGPALAKTRTFNGVNFGVNEEVAGRKRPGQAEDSAFTLKNIVDATVSFFQGTQSVEKRLSDMLKELTTKVVIQENDHPIMVMKTLGEWLFKIANGLIFMNAVVAEDMQAVLRMFTFIFGPMLFALGFTLNYIMPMMPFMIWLGCFLGWLILCVEAILAAPIWAVMHLSMSGDDMVGTGAQGYKLVLSLMLRPALMIFGFIAALTIMQVLGQFVNMVYADIFLMAQQTAGVTSILISALAFPALYLGCMWVIIIKSMEIVHKIPDQLLQWFGGGGSQLAQSADSVGGLQSQAFAATQTTGRMMGGAGEQFYRMTDMKLNAQRNQMMQKQQDNQAFQQDMAKLNENAGANANDVFAATKSGSDDDKVAFSKTPEGQQQAIAMAKNSNVIAAMPGNPQTSGGRALSNMHKEMAKDINENHMSLGQAYNKHGEKAFNEANGAKSYEFAKTLSGASGSFTEVAANGDFAKVAQTLNSHVARLDQATNGNGAAKMGEILNSNDISSASSSDKLLRVQEKVENFINNKDI